MTEEKPEAKAEDKAAETADTPAEGGSPRKGCSALEAGWFVIRVGTGVSYLLPHGWPKLRGGAEVWAEVGGAMALIGVAFAPAFWGFMASITECLGGLLLALGVLVRPVAVFLLFVMVMALVYMLDMGADVSGWSHPWKMIVVFAGFAIGGGGRCALGAAIPGLRGKCWQ